MYKFIFDLCSYCDEKLEKDIELLKTKCVTIITAVENKKIYRVSPGIEGPFAKLENADQLSPVFVAHQMEMFHITIEEFFLQAFSPITFPPRLKPYVMENEAITDVAIRMQQFAEKNKDTLDELTLVSKKAHQIYVSYFLESSPVAVLLLTMSENKK